LLDLAPPHATRAASVLLRPGGIDDFRGARAGYHITLAELMGWDAREQRDRRDDMARLTALHDRLVRTVALGEARDFWQDCVGGIGAAQVFQEWARAPRARAAPAGGAGLAARGPRPGGVAQGRGAAAASAGTGQSRRGIGMVVVQPERRQGDRPGGEVAGGAA